MTRELDADPIIDGAVMDIYQRIKCENKELRAEIERLTAALQEIAAYPHSEEGGEIARAVLEPKPTIAPCDDAEFGISTCHAVEIPH